MGFSIAKILKNEGSNLNLIVGPVNNIPDSLQAYCTHVVSAEDMLFEVSKVYKKQDIAVFAAAVSDYRPSIISNKKIKKTSDDLNIAFTKNKDIAAEMGKLKSKNQFNVGFALETNDEEINAQEKLRKKNFDLIILNSLNDKGAGFKGDTNKVSIIDNNKIRNFELKSKKEVAHDIIDAIAEKLSL